MEIVRGQRKHKTIGAILTHKIKVHDSSRAASKMLDRLDQRFELNVARACFFASWRVFAGKGSAPLSLRRNIGILGLLHKEVLGKCHPSFERLLS